jgi:hypothetical protein
MLSPLFSRVMERALPPVNLLEDTAANQGVAVSLQ